MNRLVPAVLSVGADAHDDEDQRLRKVLVLAAAFMVLPAAIVWGGIYWFFGQPLAAAVPWSYAVTGSVIIAIFVATRSYLGLAGPIFLVFIVLPLALMWVLGGFVSGSAVGLWAWLSPLGARIVGHRRAALALFVTFSVGFGLSGVLAPRLDAAYRLPDEAVAAFFILNVVAVGAITLTLIDAASGGREGTLASMRGIVRRYFSADVVDAILADPARQELGGEVEEVTILFADLGGFTTYAGAREPDEVVEFLNVLFSAAMPPILAEGGTPVQMPGDAVMAVFGAPRPAPDHAHRAARAALAIQARGHEIALDHPTWPRFRIGLNSGPALVGNIGSAEFRSFTAIGDTPNMAQRFQSLAEPGQVVIGPTTSAILASSAELASLGEVIVKGKSAPVEPSALLSMDEGTTAL